MQRKSGFTLLELMIVIAILAIGASIAIPNFIGWIPKYRLRSGTNAIHSVLQQARLLAIRYHTDIVVDFTANGYTAYADDGAGSADADNNGIPDNARNWTRDGAERVHTSGNLPAGVVVNNASFGGAPRIRFDRRGFPINTGGAIGGGNVVLNAAGGLAQTITLDITGNARIL